MSAPSVSNAGKQKRSNEEVMKDFNFYTGNYDSLVAQYANQWIAIFGEQVAASAPDYFEMEAQLEAKGIPWNQAIREYMSESREFLIASNWDTAAAIEEWQIARMISRMRDD